MKETDEKPRAASTIVLVREKGSAFDVYLLKRSGQSGFFPGSYVFPGGKVASDDRDADLWLRHSDLDLPGVERRLGGSLPSDEALAYGVAAIRETFEEGGVLLASRAQEADSGMQAICETRKVKKTFKGLVQGVGRFRRLAPAAFAAGSVGALDHARSV